MFYYTMKVIVGILTVALIALIVTGCLLYSIYWEVLL